MANPELLKSYNEVLSSFGGKLSGVIREIGNFKPAKEEGKDQQEFCWLIVDAGIRSGLWNIKFEPIHKSMFVVGQLVDFSVSAKTNKAGAQKITVII